MPLNVMSASNMGIGEAGITAIFGYCVVFVGLVLLMLVLYIMGAVFKSKAKKAEALKAAEKAAAPAEAPAARASSSSCTDPDGRPPPFRRTAADSSGTSAR